MMSYNDDTNDTNNIDYINADDEEGFKAATMSVAGAEKDYDTNDDAVTTVDANNYNIMHHHGNDNSNSNNGGGIRRLHRDYLKDLEDDVVMALPWPTPNDEQEMSDLLRRRSESKTYADRITIGVICCWVLSIGIWLLIGISAFTTGIMQDDNNKLLLFLSLGISYLISLIILLSSQFQYHRYDAQIQLLVRAIMDVHGLGQQQQRPMLARSNVSQQAHWRLPDFVDVMLRSAAEDSIELSTVTFRDSLLSRTNSTIS